MYKFDGVFPTKVIAICGFIGSGKSSVAEILNIGYGYKELHMSDKLKDAVSVIFGWDRHRLNGISLEDRLWRDSVDQYWSSQLGIIVTPRWMLQHFGTEIMRDGLHQDVWIMSSMKDISQYEKVVIPDLRFQNEEEFVKGVGGHIIRVTRKGSESTNSCHPSETYCSQIKEDVTIFNDGSIGDLKNKVAVAMRSIDALK